MNTENSKIRFKLDLKDKVNLKNPNKNMALANLSIYYNWKKSEYNNSKFNISAPTWYDTFDLPDGSYSITDIQDYFELSPKNMKFQPKIHQFKVIQIKSKTELFLKKNWV